MPPSPPAAPATLPPLPHNTLATVLRALTCLAVAAAAAWYISYSLRWHMLIDTPVMHYVVFLMHHGFRPYAQITDNNMPGAYLTEAAAMQIFGPGDLAWRIYEFFLLAVMTAAMAYLTRRTHATAGLFAAGLFLALHASEGPQFAAERELVVTVLLLLASVAMSFSLDERLPAAMLATGFAGALAASIKPTFLLFPLGLLPIAWYVLARRRRSAVPYLFWAILGMLSVALLCLAFLLRNHALPAFAFILTKVLPAYAGLTPPAWSAILRSAIPNSFLALTLIALTLALSHKADPNHRSWPQAVLALGATLGLLSFLAQRKGFPHHRYTFLVFLLLLVSTELFAALDRPGWPRYLAAAAILASLFGTIPRQTLAGARLPSQSDLYLSLSTDLDTLDNGNPAQLDHKVFCLDLVYGCLNTLYHERLVESAPFTGDLLLFAPQPNFATAFYRNRFWDAMRADPPDLLVVTNEDLMASNSFSRLNRWPQLAAYLQANYIEVIRRTFPNEKFGVHQPHPVDPADQDAYILYLRNTSPLLARAPLLANGPRQP